MSELRRDNLGWLLAKASQRWNQRLDEGFRNAGFASVRPSFGSLLVPLYEEDGLTMGELARRSGLSKQAMTTLVRAVEGGGLRDARAGCRRCAAFRVSLSPEGQQLRPVAEQVLGDLAGEMRSRLSAAELEQLADALRKVAET